LKLPHPPELLTKTGGVGFQEDFVESYNKIVSVGIINKNISAFNTATNDMVLGAGGVFHIMLHDFMFIKDIWHKTRKA